MKIVKDKHTIEISLGSEVVSFGGLARMRKKAMAELGDELLLVELNRLWSHYDHETQEQVFQCYKDLEELSTESMEVIEKFLPELFARLVALHPADVIMRMYPRERVWIPDTLHEGFDRMSPNYTQKKTYLAVDYYHLIILAIQLKPLLPIFGMLQVYDSQRSVRRRNNEERERNEREQLQRRRGTIQRTIMAFNALMQTPMAQSPSVEKLRDYLAEIVKDFQKDLQRGTSSIETIAAYCGFGTDMLDDYMMAFAVVNVLAQQIVGAVRSHSLNDNAQLVTEIYFAVKGEVETGFSSKLTIKQIVSKQSIRNVVVGGERGKFSSIDLVSARSDAPIGESIRSEVQFTHTPFQRVLYKQMGIDLSFDEVMTLVNEAKITGQDQPFYEVQEWLVALVMHRFAHHNTYKDMDPMPMRAAVGWAQAIYLHYGMFSIAQLLACRVRPRDLNQLGYIVDPYAHVSKEEADRFYPQGYNVYRNNAQPQYQNVLHQSIQAFIGLMNRYEFVLDVTNPEVARLLHCNTTTSPETELLLPDPKIGQLLIEMSLIQARSKLKEVDFYTN